MSLYVEVADLSFVLDNISFDMVTEDVRHFIKTAPTSGYRKVLCRIKMVEDYDPISGEILIQDPYRIVLRQKGKEQRIFFANPYTDIYGIYKEVGPDEMIIETTKRVLDMWFIQLLTLEKYLLEQNAFVFHSCYVSYTEAGIVFTAPSGTGKSTQGDLWEKHGGGEVVNGDRSILQLKDGEWYVHSLPFCGSSFVNKNQSCRLKSVVIVNRDMTDFVVDCDYDVDLGRIMNEVTVNRWNQDAVAHVLKLVNQLFADRKVINLHCTMNPEACYSLKEFLFHDEF